MDEEKLNEIIKKYDAVFIAANKLMPLFDINTETFQVGDSKIYVGKRNEDNKSLVFSVYSGRRAAFSIDRFVKGVSITASRDNEGSYETILKYISDDEETKEKTNKCDEIFTKEQAIEEAKRCFKCQCRDCIKPCVHLQRFNIAPKSYIRNINHNERIIKVSHNSNKKILSCTECGLCGLMCDYDVNMKDVICQTKESMVERNKMPQSAHDFALKDMKFSNSE